MKNDFYLSGFVRAFFEDYLVCRRHLCQNTIRSYRDAIKLFIGHVADRLRKRPTRLLVADITDELVVGFLEDLEKTRGNSIQSRNQRLVVLRRLFEYVALQEPVLSERCRRITSIPCKKHQALPEITYLEKNEMMGIVNAPNRRTALGRRDHAILLFMYNTGARVQEVADARASWLTLEPPPRTEILGKGRKWRTCPLWDSVAAVLIQVLHEHSPRGPDDPHLFLNRYGQPISRFGIGKIIEKYKKQATATTPSLRTKRVTPHTIRHTTAMHLLQSGVEINVIRSWLGHVNLATTHRYVEIDLAMKRKALESCEVTTEEVPRGRWRSDPDILMWLESL